MLIGFLGAPSSGKTTAALALAHELKARGLPVEFYPEAARKIIAEDAKESPERQQRIYQGDSDNALFWKQKRDRIVITDGGSFNAPFYGTDCCFKEELNKYDLVYFCENIYDIGLKDPGRLHNVTESRHIHHEMSDYFDCALAFYKRECLMMVWSEQKRSADKIAHLFKTKALRQAR